MPQNLEGRPIKEDYDVCQIDDEQGDFVKYGPRGSHHSRIRKADLEKGVIAEKYGRKVDNDKILNLRKYHEWQADGFPPPADRTIRVDEEVEKALKSKGESTFDKPNNILRRLLGLRP